MVVAKHALYKGNARVNAYFKRLRLAGLLLICLKMLLKADPQALARHEKVLNQLAILLLSEILDDLIGAFVLVGRLDEQQPYVVGEIG
jgi:hypothetical protein